MHFKRVKMSETPCRWHFLDQFCTTHCWGRLIRGSSYTRVYTVHTNLTDIFLPEIFFFFSFEIIGCFVTLVHSRLRVQLSDINLSEKCQKSVKMPRKNLNKVNKIGREMTLGRNCPITKPQNVINLIDFKHPELGDLVSQFVYLYSLPSPSNVFLFNTVLRRCVAWIRSSLLVKIQWQKHHYISEHGCYSVRDL